ncbi:MAG: hypothetical protein JWN67_2051 [Actinomycetia bacterium]|nr:hypothetical protein [Actinomycetes bacterium]
MNPMRKALLGGTIVASTLAGGALGAALLGGTANAADTTTTTAAATAPAAAAAAAPSAAGAGAPSTDARPDRDPSQGGHQANGITETLLTGDTATKVKEAALAAAPGATIERVETDAEGDAYEAHIVKADGTHATVKLDESFKVTSVETGR